MQYITEGSYNSIIGFLSKSRCLKEINTYEYNKMKATYDHLLKNNYQYAILNSDSLSNLEKYVYPKIARMYGEKASNVKSRINKETTLMYYNCEINKLKKYFYLDFDTKPKVKYVINMIGNKVN